MKVPAGAMEQAVDPAKLKVPALHFMQSMAKVEAAFVPIVPAAH